MGVSIPVLPYFLANAKLLADKLLVVGNFLEEAMETCLKTLGLNVVMAGQEALKS